MSPVHDIKTHKLSTSHTVEKLNDLIHIAFTDKLIYNR